MDEDRAHDDVLRESFRRQVDAFASGDSVYAQRDSALGWIELLESSMIALEVACGAAHVAESVAPRVHQWSASTSPPELLDVGAERLRVNGIRNVLLQRGTAQALPFVAASFDVVFCRSSLQPLPRPAGTLGEMVRVTRRGGRVVIVDLVAPAGVDRDRFDHLHRLLDPSHVRTFLEDELAAEFPTEATVTYSDTARFRFPIDVAMSEQSDRDAVLAALRDELSGGERTGFDPAETDGSIEVSFVVSTVHAEHRLL